MYIFENIILNAGCIVKGLRNGMILLENVMQSACAFSRNCANGTGLASLITTGEFLREAIFKNVIQS